MATIDEAAFHAWQTAYAALVAMGQRVKANDKNGHIELYPQKRERGENYAALLYKPTRTPDTPPLHLRRNEWFRQDVWDAIQPFVDAPSEAVDGRGYRYFNVTDWPQFTEALRKILVR